jgi:tetratricopeptide (TPR) repeat protein
MTDESHVAKLIQQAESCLNKGELAQARRLYAEICRTNENDPHAWLMFGAINGELGNVEVARNALERAIALDPANAEAHLSLAHLFRAKGQPAEAMASASRSVEADAKFVEGWLFIAAIAGQAADGPRAEEASNKAIALAPERVEAHVNLGNVLLATGRAPQAEETFRKALELGKTAAAWFGLGSALVVQNRHADAEPPLAAALRFNPDSAIFRQALATCLERLERADEAAGVRAGAGRP